jgi:hypothetical protein
MTQTMAQPKYQALKDALLYAKVGMRTKMNRALDLAKRYSQESGIPLAPSVEKRIQEIYSSERLRKGDGIVVFYRDLAKEARGRSSQALMGGDLAALNYAINEEEIFREKARRAARELGIDEVVASL